MTALLELDGLGKDFGPIRAVDAISLSVARGEVLGFLGPNGAGKSTTMRMAAGFLKPDRGAARLCGHDVLDQPGAARALLGYLPEGAPSYGDMPVRRFIEFCARIRGLGGHGLAKAVDEAMALTGLAPVAGQLIETLSKGFKRRVGLAQAIVHKPQVMILDEPTDGLDPNQKHQMRTLIRNMAQHAAIIISTHILEEVDAVCSRAIIIDRGRIVADGSADSLRTLLPGRQQATLDDVFRHVTTLGEDLPS